MKDRLPRYFSGNTIVVLGATLCVVVVVAITHVTLVVSVRELVLHTIAPSVERSIAFGNRRFNAIEPEMYDIVRAEYFFREAERMNPEAPYLQHQLARIAFLRGDFSSALSHINREIDRYPEHMNSFYVRALIHGFAGKYEESARDYETYLHSDPKNWAALNDYAWVLIKAKHYREALNVLDWGLIYWPDNAWLLNNRATALFEMRRRGEALESAQNAERAMENVTESDWLSAYPGNDPLVAPEGVAALKNAISENIHTIEVALSSRGKNMQQ